MNLADKVAALTASLLAAGLSEASLWEAIQREGRELFGLPAETVNEILISGAAHLPGETAVFAAVARAFLQRAASATELPAAYPEVLARLDQLNRELERAERLEWIATERLRIARELHDRVAQTLFALGLKSEWLQAHLDRDEHLRPELERVRQLATAGLRQVREAIFSLSSKPVEAAQFRAAVQALLQELEGAGVHGELQVWGDLQQVPPEVTDALYQVIREALVNVRRHAGASTVLVSIRTRPENVTAVVQDDGQGLPPGVMETFRESGAHLGLRGMESRVQSLGGALTMAPGDECGLVVTASVPLGEKLKTG